MANGVSLTNRHCALHLSTLGFCGVVGPLMVVLVLHTITLITIPTQFPSVVFWLCIQGGSGILYLST